MPRILAIGDIHGCTRALDLLLADVNPQADDTIIALGDYVDRGPDSRGVLERMIELKRTGQLIALRGNHEQMMAAARESRDERNAWLKCGGEATMISYGRYGRPGAMDDIPDRHWDFIENACVDWHETDSHIFVHAGAHPQLALDDQPEFMLFWEPFENRGPHCSGKIVICGHTRQQNGIPLNYGHAVCIDTWVYGDGWLTCLDVDSGAFWQTSEKGERRSAHLSDYLVDGDAE